MSPCSGTGRPVTVRAWRSYYYCPTCGKRLHADQAESVMHPNPLYTNVIVPLHKPKVER